MNFVGKQGLLASLRAFCPAWGGVMVLLLVGSCGGGGSGGDFVVPGAVSSELEYNACESTYYRNIIGRFSGTVEYRLVDGQEELLHHCLFSVDIEITGTPDIGPTPQTADQCFLTGSTTGVVEQFVFLPADQMGATECIATNGTLRISDPNQSVIDPEIFYENISYPVSLGANGPIHENFGPYQGSTDQIVQYTYLFGSNNGVSNAISINSDGELEVAIGSSQFSVSGGILISNMERSN